MRKFTKKTVQTVAILFATLFFTFKANAQLYSSGNNTITGNNVGVGTSTPNTSLFVKPPTYLASGKGKTSPFHVEYYDNPVVPPGNVSSPMYKSAIFVKWDGLIGIHTDNPLEQFHINATIRGGASAGTLKLQTDYGYLTFGAQNAGFMHFISDLPKFYFNKRLIIDEGMISSYNEDLQLQTSQTTRVTISNTTGDVTLNGGRLVLENPSGLGSGTNQVALNANGIIECREVQVDLGVIPDYVFDKDYNLLSLEEVKAFIEENGHLPNVKSEAEFQEEGSISLTEMNLKLLEKVEELTLYILQLEERIGKLEK